MGFSGMMEVKVLLECVDKIKEIQWMDKVWLNSLGNRNVII